MKETTNLIVMLTQDDLTVGNAYEIFDRYKHTQAQFWGCKESPLPFDQLKELYAHMKACGKTTALEVVAYTEEACLEGARMAAACGCDILLGTLFYESVRDLCQEHKLKYMPFVGTISGRPSVLHGSVDEMIAHANSCLEKGVYGFDLLGYRYVADATELIRRFVSQVKAPVCVAGSVNSFQKLDELKAAAPWAFTIGSAFFENAFPGTFGQQIDCVCDYMRR